MAKNLDREESLIINTQKPQEDLKKEIPDFQGKIYALDALSSALKITGQPAINSVILGKLIKVTEVVKLESVIKEFRKLFEKKIGKEMTNKNIQAIQEGYDAM